MISLKDIQIQERARSSARSTGMTPTELKAIRARLQLTQLELGQWLGIEGRDPGHTVRMWEIGKRGISGPITVLLEAFLSGWRPRHITQLDTQEGTPTNG